MPRKAIELPDVAIRRLRHKVNASGEMSKEKYPVGGVSGLYLQCMPPVGNEKIGSRQWILRTLVGSKRKEFGLGGYPSVPTKDAREAARVLLEDIKSGIDPISEKKAQQAQLKAIQKKEITFEQYARQKFIPEEVASYKGAPQVKRINNIFNNVIFPHIGHMYFEDITKKDIHDILDPIIGAHLPPESIMKEKGMRTKDYLNAIIQRAISDRLRTEGNPAIWKNGLQPSYKHLKKIKPKNHRSIESEELPKFIRTLITLDKNRNRPDVQCMVFMILTVSRSQEARLADWKEIDLKKKIWRQPAGKYKSELDWDIPLCPTAIKILKAQPSYPKKQGRIFSTIEGGELYSATLSSMPDALGFNGVAHGFRSTFKSWCQKGQVNDEVSELSLKHAETASTRAAYAKDQLLQQRKALINEYEKFAMPGPSEAWPGRHRNK